METPTLPDYKQHSIELSPADGYQFIVKGPTFDDDESVMYASMHEAKLGIDKRIEAKLRQSRVQHTLQLTLLDGLGEEIEVRGIHLSHGRMLGVKGVELPPTGPRTDTATYPNIEWVKLALQRRKQLLQEASDIWSRLMRVGVRSERVHGRVSAATYDSHIETMTEEVDRKTAIANAMSEQL